MRIHCNGCGKPVSSEVPEDTIIRAWVECPECGAGDSEVNDNPNSNEKEDSTSRTISMMKEGWKMIVRESVGI